MEVQQVIGFVVQDILRFAQAYKLMRYRQICCNQAETMDGVRLLEETLRSPAEEMSGKACYDDPKPA